MPQQDDLRLIPCLTPHGRLQLRRADDAPELEHAVGERLARAFERGAGQGLLQLGGAEVAQPLPPVLAYWREFASRYVAAVCARDASGEIAPPEHETLAALAASVPPMPGAEYLTADVLHVLWQEIDAAFAAEHARSHVPVASFLKSLHPSWNVVGRVHFNLAENRSDPEAPFAFLATYTSSMSARGKAQHVPLGQALREYAGAANKQKLLSLLVPVQRAAELCPWLKAMVDAGEIFHPLRWSAGEALQLLADVSQLERAGVVVRMPAHWRSGRPPRAQVTAKIGAKEPGRLGADALLDFDMQVTLGGEPLSAAEVQQLLQGASGLALVRGQWVEVDQARLRHAIERFERAERLAREGGFTFVEAMRMIAGAGIQSDAAELAESSWSGVVAGPWLAEVLRGLRAPEELDRVDPGPALNGTLRPYQQVGVRWLRFLSTLGLGACLADDMGLGKTIQVLALLLVQRGGSVSRPNLLVAPASLLANWAAEIERFAPSLSVLVAHSSAMSASELQGPAPRAVADADVVITSYGSLLRLPWLASTPWQLVILDEAQAIKNPDAKQTRAVKRLASRARIALTGTPIENRLGDLWSIFDFINPGLLGSAREFSAYTKRIAQQSNPYAALRELVRPYILRRLKTDRSVIDDLPDKTELKAYCALSRKQVALYQQAVDELAQQLEQARDGIRRKGVVLAFLMRFKQICNHPSHWLGDGSWAESESGKWRRLRELCEVIATKQEKVLVFTQFRELTDPLAAFLEQVFGHHGLVLHGATPVKQRQELVRQFQDDETIPFFVLSLKAGGSGLNLTAATHVVHFDRWWNPAVENQATDRAFRIGQSKNVLVHKFICRGTIDERIDGLIESKKQLSRDLLEGSAELKLTELKDAELLELIALDLNAVIKE
ncbi:MAG: DEAD/DEAH box helicase [Planctomycetota bacterium]